MQPQMTGFNPAAAQAKQAKLIRLVIILALATVLVLILIAILAPKDTVNEKLALALARHQEVSRVLDQYSDRARSAETRQLVANAKLVILSAAQDMASAGISVSTGQADSVKIADIDTQLETAAANNSFDEAITRFITSNLEVTAAELKTIQDRLDGQRAEVVSRLLSDYDNLL